MDEKIDDRGASFKESFLDVMEGANDEQLCFALEWLWAFRKFVIVRWVNNHLLKHEIPERE